MGWFDYNKDKIYCQEWEVCRLVQSLSICFGFVSVCVSCQKGKMIFLCCIYDLNLSRNRFFVFIFGHPQRQPTPHRFISLLRISYLTGTLLT